MAALNFNAATVAPASDFEPLPAGDYNVVIIDSAMEAMKSGNGDALKLTMQVVDGPAANRLLWERLSIVHTNQKTVEIAQQKLSAICHAINVMQLSDSAQLHNKPLVARVKYVEGDGQYRPKNEIQSYKAIGSATRPAPAATQPAAQPRSWQPPANPPPAATQAPVHAAPPPPKTGPSAPPWLSGKAA